MRRTLNPDDVRMFSGRAHPALAAGIAAHLNIALEKTYFSRFSNDNMFIQLGASVRGRVVYIIQSLVPPVSDHLLETLMMIDIAHSAAARETHVVIPYFSYARSDKKDAPRISITARLIANLLQTAGATQVMTMTLHSPQVHGFFNIPADPLTARGLFVNHFSSRDLSPTETIVVAPDYGRAGSASRLAGQLGLPAVSAEKTRLSDTNVRISELVIKQVKGFKQAIIYDDEIATGGSVIELCRQLIIGGIERISVVCTHGLFIGKALDRLCDIPQVTEIVTTDTVPTPVNPPSHMTILSVAPIFGEAILRNYTRQSIGDLFTFWDDNE
jgi:ribose-phosphate pyrophosphokinase